MKTIYYSRANSRALQIVDEPKAGAWVSVVEATKLELDALARDFKLD